MEYPEGNNAIKWTKQFVKRDFKKGNGRKWWWTNVPENIRKIRERKFSPCVLRFCFTKKVKRNRFHLWQFS
jgi:hypothetical protein